LLAGMSFLYSTMFSIGRSPEGGGIALGDRQRDPASPVRTSKRLFGFGSLNLALEWPIGPEARLDVTSGVSRHRTSFISLPERQTGSRRLA
jgi:hypothetical protein